MSVRHPKAVEWERRLKAVFDRIDDQLEERHGQRFGLHPARARRRATANPEDDGLFDVGAGYSPGPGTPHGPGYVVDVRVATLDTVPREWRAEIEQEVAEALVRALPEAFPGRALRVVRAGPVLKIVGDLGLGKA